MEVTKVYLCCSRQGGLPMMPVQLKMFASQPMMSDWRPTYDVRLLYTEILWDSLQIGSLCFSSLALKIVVVKK